MKTRFSVSPSNFSKGKIKFNRVSGSSELKKLIEQENAALEILQRKLDELKAKVIANLNTRKDYEIINSDWLRQIINPQKKEFVPHKLVDYFDFYFKSKKQSIRPSTEKKMRVFQNRLKRYQETYPPVMIEDVNKKFAASLQRWCEKENYAHNTIVKTLKVILTLCNHARENGVPSHPELEFITKGKKYRKTEHIHLNFEEIQKIISVEIEQEHLDIARDWLIISCFTAQRVSDFLRFKKENVVDMEGLKFLDISQEKTQKSVYIPLNDEVLTVLDKRKGNFPPIFSDNVESNKALYNRYIKKVCKLAEIDEMVTVYRKDKETKRYRSMEMPKYDAVSTHIGRRSFATNYYGKINTALLISATGHSSEQQFLRYVGKQGNQNALSLAKAMKDLAKLEAREQHKAAPMRKA
ncbi:phage integrase SAM-like domain-containing protein [Salegentibacter sp. HM20]